MRYNIYIFTLIMMSLFVTTSTATAATVIQLDLSLLVEQSDVIVVAEVIETESNLEDDGRVYTTIRFSTDETLKGAPGKEFTIRQVGGRAGDIATRAPGMPDFEARERVFLFLREHHSNPIVTGLAQGKFKIAVGPDEQTEYVIPQIENLHLISPNNDKQGRSRGSDTRTQRSAGDPAAHAELFQQVHELSSFRNRVETAIKVQEKGTQ